jgi:FlaA1/EpsC-like NDP-sugar epimerase
MTRFWWKVSDAAKFVIKCVNGMSGGEIFIPKIKSYPVERLAELLYPKLPRKTIGTRDAGEKLHEEMISPCEVPFTKDHGDFYIIYGNHYGGTPLESDFEYRSDLTESYTDEEMREMINVV